MIRTTRALLSKSLVLAALLSITWTARAGSPYPNTSYMQAFSKDAAWYQQCLRVEHAELPASDDPGGGGAAPCDANDLYYDKRSQAAAGAAEWEQVRRCAIATSDDKVLMMLYANGYGVARNRDLALRYACSLDQVAPAEMEYRVAHLLRGTAERGHKDFDFCDDITSGVSGAVCAWTEERQDAKARQARLSAFANQLAPQAKAAFTALRTAADLFAEAVSDKETDMHGSGAVGLAIQAKGTQGELFVTDIFDAAEGIVPHYTADEIEFLNTALDAAYETILHTPSQQQGNDERIGFLTVTRAGVRQTEDLWLAYRDAWVTYAAAVHVDPVSVKALLTQRRIKQLLDMR